MYFIFKLIAHIFLLIHYAEAWAGEKLRLSYIIKPCFDLPGWLCVWVRHNTRHCWLALCRHFWLSLRQCQLEPTYIKVLLKLHTKIILLTLMYLHTGLKIIVQSNLHMILKIINKISFSLCFSSSLSLSLSHMKINWIDIILINFIIK